MSGYPSLIVTDLQQWAFRTHIIKMLAMFNVIMKAGAYPDPHSYLFAHYSMQLNNYQVLHVGSQQSIFM